MSKASVIREVCDRTGFGKIDVTIVINSLLDVMREETLTKGQCIIYGFGTLYKHVRPERERPNTLNHLKKPTVTIKEKVSIKMRQPDYITRVQTKEYNQDKSK